ncbi:MAG TPA: discoidin domain-containing protein, partial [Opitutus sp.]|nr:discoidin domain-containing protein [Opitutus sp.]
NHLVCSGHYVREQEIPSSYLTDPNIDLIDAHYYGYHGYPSLRTKLEQHVAITAGHRPMIVGEFGMDTTAAFTDLMNGIIASPNVAGGLLWNLRPRTVSGGYFRKDGGVVSGVLYRGYRWPGYSTSGGAWDERNALAAVRTKAFQIRGIAVPAVPVPPAPLLFTPPSASMLTWRGATSAATYVVERAAGASGPWTEIASGVTDDRDKGSPLYTDLSGTIGSTYYYRVKARNGTGTSAASNVIGPIVYGVSNKAPSATLTVDSTSPGYAAAFAVDGIKHTAASRWVSTAATSTHTFQLDWSSPQTLRNVKIWSGFPGNHANWQLRAFSVACWNGSAWVTLGSVAANLDDAYHGQYNWIAFPGVSTTRLRLTITEPSSSDSIARLCESEVY